MARSGEKARSATPAFAGRTLVNAAYAVVLLAGGLAPNPPVISPAFTDATLHGVAYFIQTILLFWLLGALVNRSLALLTAAFGAAFFGALIEFLQLLQPARFFEGRDLVANLTGIVLASFLVLIVNSVRGLR